MPKMRTASPVQRTKIDFIERFLESFPSKEPASLQDINDYIQWETNHGEYEFDPRASDDVAIRTYLLDCRTRGASRASLDRIVTSLEQFYLWLKEAGVVAENPFEKFNLQRPSLDPKYIRCRHNAFPGSSKERELARLRALNRLAESTNLAPDVQSMLDASLETMLGVMDLETAWAALKADSGLLKQADGAKPAHGFVIAAVKNLPPSLEKSNRRQLTRLPECHCQQLLRSGQLKRGVNIVECSRLQKARQEGQDNNGLTFHASVPIVCSGQAVGLMNFATQDWRLLSASDLQFLTAGARQVGSALERAHLYDNIHTEHTRLGNELDMARKVQVSLLPAELPEIAGYSLAASWQPARETSGDYYNVFKLPDNRWGLIIADVCGKGAPAALYMAMVHSMIRERVERETSPASLLSKVNRALCRQRMEMQFITSFYGILDPVKATLKYALAGHPPPLLRKMSGQVKVLDGKGIALGVSNDARYEDMHLALEPGDSLVAFTDGATDANNAENQSYELAKLRETISSAPARAAALLTHLQSKLVEWVKDIPSYDDITFLVLSRGQ
jgi:serine phosphatase RsbU (regulator of sigma subunit)